MPLIPNSIEEQLNSVVVYLNDLLWVEEIIFDPTHYYRTSINFDLNDRSYTVFSVNELVTELNKLGVYETNYISMSGLFEVHFGYGATHFRLHKVTDENIGKMFKAMDYLKSKQKKSPDKPQSIYLYNKPPVKIPENQNLESKIEVEKPEISTDVLQKPNKPLIRFIQKHKDLIQIILTVIGVIVAIIFGITQL